jgi:hypothetical protein
MKLRTLALIAFVAIALPARSAQISQTLKVLPVGSDGQAVQVSDVIAGSSSGQTAGATSTVTFADPEGVGNPVTITPAATATVSVGAGAPLAIPKVTVKIVTPATWTLLTNPTITGLTNETHQFNAGTMTVTGDLGVSGATVSYQLQVHL